MGHRELGDNRLMRLPCAGYGYYAFSDATSKYNQSSCGVADSVIVPSI